MANYDEDKPKSMCYCGHTGDGANSQHGGLMGHGPCLECDCIQFTWKGWLPEYDEWYKKQEKDDVPEPADMTDMKGKGRYA